MGKELKPQGLGMALLDEGLITRSQLETAREEFFRSGRPYPSIFIDMGVLTEKSLLEFLQRNLGFERIGLNTITIEMSIFQLIPRNFAMPRRLTPVQFENDALVVAMEDPTDTQVVEDLRRQVPFPIKLVVAAPTEIDEALARYPDTGEHTAEMAVLTLKEKPMWWRALRYCLFPVMLLVPIAVLLGAMAQTYSPALQHTAFRWVSNRFDFAIQFFVFYGIWAVALWFVNGVVFAEEPTGPPAGESPE